MGDDVEAVTVDHDEVEPSGGPTGMPPFPGLDDPDPLVRQCAEGLWYGRPGGRGRQADGRLTGGWGRDH